MILTHESGSKEDQFDEKKMEAKISCYYPFQLLKIVQLQRRRRIITIKQILYAFMPIGLTH